MSLANVEYYQVLVLALSFSTVLTLQVNYFIVIKKDRDYLNWLCVLICAFVDFFTLDIGRCGCIRDLSICNCRSLFEQIGGTIKKDYEWNYPIRDLNHSVYFINSNIT